MKLLRSTQIQFWLPHICDTKVQRTKARCEIAESTPDGERHIEAEWAEWRRSKQRLTAAEC